MANQRSLMKSIVASALWLSLAAGQQYFEGEGTTYTLGRSDAGNCNMMHVNSDAVTNYAAINDVQWDSLRNCGRCAEVSCADARCADKTTTKIVQILDRCPECAHGDLDLSPSVFTALTGSGPNRYKIRWRFIDCPAVQGPIKYCLKAGSNPFWTAVQPTNVVSGVTSLKINGRVTTSLGSAYYYLLDGQGSSQTDLSAVQVTLTSVNGEVVQDTVSLSAGGCTDGSSQFGRGLIPGPVVTPASTPSPSSSTIPATSPPPSSAGSLAQPTPTSASSDTSTSSEPNSSALLEDAENGDNTPSNTNAANPAPVTADQDDDRTETITKAEAGDPRTSPTVVVLSVCGAMAVVALVVVALIARNKKIQEKRRDAEADLAYLRHAAFISITTPTNQRLSSLRLPSECEL